MNRFLIRLTVILLGVVLNIYSPSVYAYDKTLLQQADQLRGEQSYQLAIPKYQVLLKDSTVNEKEKREFQFKLADSLWRSRNGQADQEAEKILKELAEGQDRDRWQAEAAESLSEYYLLIDRWSHTEEIKNDLTAARDYWAGETDLELARSRFIRASFTLGDYLSQNWGWYYTGIQPTRHSKNPQPIAPGPEPVYGLDVIYQEILQVAKDDNDKARAYYSLGMTYYNRGFQEEQKKDIEKYFSKVIEDFPKSEWVDDAYYYLAQMHERFNDFPKAVAMYKDLVQRFPAGTSAWVDDAKNRIKDITSPSVSVSAGYTFLPDSEIQFSLNWRNVKEVNISLYRIDLVEGLAINPLKALTDDERGIENYQEILQRIVESGRYAVLPKVKSWSKALKEEGKHLFYGENKGLAEWQLANDQEKAEPATGKLAPGAYLLLVSGAGEPAYDLILVTDLAMVVKTAGHSALFYVADSATGAPQKAAQVKYHYRYQNIDGNWLWEEGFGQTDDHGLLSVRLKTGDNSNYSDQHNIFAVASTGEKQTFAQGNYYDYYGQQGNWWLYAFSDRPAYRPNEEVSFKGIVRRYNGEAFQNTQGLRIKARLYDPRGNTIKETDYTLNTYGSFYDTITLDEKAPLGEYRLEIWSEDWNNHLGSATIFRLEEYKLPEFLVSIKPKPKEEGGVSTYRLGDTVEVELDAQYYFGGPVANAEVEYLVYQNPYYHTYYPVREYAWYYADWYPQQYAYGYGQLIKTEKIKTDEHGRAVFQFETPKEIGYDLSYHVEARVVDQSRREITSSADVKVTRHSYYAYLTPKQNLYRPGDKTEVTLKTLTANEEPVAVEGKVTVTRNWWTQPVAEGKAAEGDVVTSQPAHYSGTEVLTKFIKTDEKGEATFNFEPHEDGYYVVTFTGFEAGGGTIETTASVYVCATGSRDIGYRYGGLQIIAEKDTYRVGETARVMLVADNPGAWVLLTAEAEEIQDYTLHHLEGPVKLVEFPVRDTFTPNIFLYALSAENHQFRVYELPLIVPPEEKFLNVKITSDKETYGPGEEGHFDIEVTDKNGQPVSAEMALGIVDKSVYYIQADYAGDIRQFFYGQKRNHSVSTSTSMEYRPYQSLLRDDKDQLMTESELDYRRKNKGGAKQEGDEFAQVGGRLEEGVSNGAFASTRMLAAKSSAVADEVMMREDKSIVASGERADLPATAAPSEQEPGAAGELATAEVRTDFRSTVIWQPAIVTDEAGRAQVVVKFPDSLTTWTTTARSITQDTRVGTVTHEVKTKKEIIVRLQAPRFFTERDRVTISANVHNYTEAEQKIKVSIEATGLDLDGEKSVWITVPAQGEERVDWPASVPGGKTAEITVMAQATKEADAMKRSYPILAHGIEKFIAQAVALKSGDGNSVVQEFTLNVPKERIKESTGLQIVLSPSMAAAMLDALPYLADYPYGCVEQTMSRFLPSVIVAKTMRDLGISNEQAMAYISDVLEPRKDPKGHPERRNDPTLSRMNAMVKDGLKRLYDFQHSDGGWGWWKEGDSDRFMSAYVVWGLSLAQQAGIDIHSGALSNGVRYLQTQLVEEENNPDMLAWMLHALAVARSNSEFEDVQSQRLWEMRDQLNPYTRALFALSEHYRGHAEQAQVLARNLSNGILEDKDNGTAHWGAADVHYRWSEGGVEATSFVIKALSNIDPQSPYLEPAVKWLALNRRGASWKNTRDTAIAILSLSDYLKTTAELNPDYQYIVTVNGKVVREGTVNSENVLTFGRIIDLGPDALLDGKNSVKVEMKGRGALYAAGYLKYFTLEEDITPAGNEIFVERRYQHTAQKETLMKGYVEDWTPLDNGSQIQSGERVKVEILLEAKNNYEYLVVEDYKPAGFEAVELQSGTVWFESVDEKGRPSGETVWSYREFRDQKVAFFIGHLPQGRYKITYELRAEVPGEFHGMPNQTHAMYVPEIRANSSEARLTVVDRE